MPGRPTHGPPWRAAPRLRERTGCRGPSSSRRRTRTGARPAREQQRRGAAGRFVSSVRSDPQGVTSWRNPDSIVQHPRAGQVQRLAQRPETRAQVVQFPEFRDKVVHRPTRRSGRQTTATSTSSPRAALNRAPRRSAPSPPSRHPSPSSSVRGHSVRDKPSSARSGGRGSAGCSAGPFRCKLISCFLGPCASSDRPRCVGPKHLTRPSNQSGAPVIHQGRRPVNSTHVR